jgi:hypothetical protein
MWPKSVVPTIVTSPAYHKPIWRPKKARKTSAVEMEDCSGKGKATSKTCGIFKKKGHNKRNCKGQDQIKSRGWDLLFSSDVFRFVEIDFSM